MAGHAGGVHRCAERVCSGRDHGSDRRAGGAGRGPHPALSRRRGENCGGEIMKCNYEDTTMKNNPVALAQIELNAASEELTQARKAYRLNPSDANFAALEVAREKFLSVENEIR